MKLSETMKILDAIPLFDMSPAVFEKELSTGGASDLMSDILAGLSGNCLLLTGLTNVQVVRTAMIAGVGAVVFVRGKRPQEEVTAMAHDSGIPLFSTPYSMFVSSGRLYELGFTGLDGSR